MLIELNNIFKTYRGVSKESGGRNDVKALDDVTLSVKAGEFVAVRGPSGCGKTTLLLVTGGLLAPDSGTVQVVEEDPYALSRDARAAMRGSTIGFVFQQFHLVPYLTVLDNVLAPSMVTPSKDARDRARELLVHFGMEPRINHVPAQLSTGERQRTALARALLNRPKVILADEPTGNLDQSNGEAVLGFLNEFANDGGAVLLVTHDEKATQFATRTERILDGRLVVAKSEQL
jgi:putative ABC transport system ATP-binding protein